MSKKRRQHSPDLKAKVGLEALKGIEPVHSIAAKYQVHPVQVSQWKGKNEGVRLLIFHIVKAMKDKNPSVTPNATIARAGAIRRAVGLATPNFQLSTERYPKCRDSRSASATSVRTGLAAELKGITDMSQT